MSLVGELLAARPDDPLLRWMVTEKSNGDLSVCDIVASEGANVAWLGRASRPGERWVSGVGDEPEVVARLVEQLAGRHEVDGVTVSDLAFPDLPTRLQSPDPGHWCFWTREPNSSGLDPRDAHTLASDDARIADLLQHSSSAHVFPGDDRIVQWAGIERDGDLVSVAGRMREPSGAAHLVSVCTDPRQRGLGLAEATCARLMIDAVADGAPIIVLEMYVANEAGRALYARLGFVERGRYKSGLLAA